MHYNASEGSSDVEPGSERLDNSYIYDFLVTLSQYLMKYCHFYMFNRY